MSIKNILIVFCLLMRCSLVLAQQVIALYPGPIPGALVSTDTASKYTRPTLTVFLASGVGVAKPAVVICPGGSYSNLQYQKEGVQVAEAFCRIGVSAFVLSYRLPKPRTMKNRSLAPLQDAQQAIRLLRENARRWQLDTGKIGIAGFSAGGHLAASAATHFNDALAPDPGNVNVRPDFVVLAYPVISFTDQLTHMDSRKNLLGKDQITEANIKYFSNEMQITDQTPPVFLVHAGDDKIVDVMNSLVFYQALHQHNVSAEMHIYPHGGHGFGLHNYTTKDQWIDRLESWMKMNHWL